MLVGVLLSLSLKEWLLNQYTRFPSIPNSPTSGYLIQHLLDVVVSGKTPLYFQDLRPMRTQFVLHYLAEN